MTADPSELRQLRGDIGKVHDKVDDQAKETRRVISEQTDKIHGIDKTMTRIDITLKGFARPCSDLQVLTSEVEATNKTVGEHLEASGEVNKAWYQGLVGMVFGLLKFGVAGVAGWLASHWLRI